MNKIGAYIFIIFIAGTVCYSLLKKRNVFQDFTDGVLSGLKTGLAIFPAITAMMLAVNMFYKIGSLRLLHKTYNACFYKYRYSCRTDTSDNTNSAVGQRVTKHI